MRNFQPLCLQALLLMALFTAFSCASIEQDADNQDSVNIQSDNQANQNFDNQQQDNQNLDNQQQNNQNLDNQLQNNDNLVSQQEDQKLQDDEFADTDDNDDQQWQNFDLDQDSNPASASTPSYDAASQKLRFVVANGTEAFAKPDHTAKVVYVYHRGDPLVVSIQGDWAKIAPTRYIPSSALSKQLVSRASNPNPWRQSPTLTGGR